MSSSEFNIRLLGSDELSLESANDQFLTAMEPAEELRNEDDFELFKVSFADAKHQVLGHLAQQGALLLRDLPLENPNMAEDLLRELGIKFDNEYLAGASPRTRVSDNFFTTTEAPDSLIISFHTEMCYLRQRPGKIFFFCQQAPQRYGETPVVDCAAAFKYLPATLQAKIEDLGVMYQRYFGARKAKNGAYKTWMDAFNASSREEVAKACALQRMTFEWQYDGGLLTRTKTPGVMTHPITGDQCLSLTVYNTHTAKCDMRQFRKRYAPFQRFALERLLKYHYTKERFFMRTLWGDGSEISKDETRQIIGAAWRAATLFKWQKGDLLLLDNIRCGHGRLNVEGPRSILAAQGDPYWAV